MNARILAKLILLDIENKKQFSNIALDAKLKNSDLGVADRGLVSVLVLGVTERKITLDYYVSKLSDRQVNEIDAEVLCAVRMGLYQLIYLDRIPAHAAINESVSLCRSPRHAAFVNAVLRSYLRRRDEISLPTAPTAGAENYESLAVRYLSVRYSVCEELCKKFLSVFGMERSESLFASFFGASGTTLRVNTLKTTREELAAKINSLNGTARLTRLAPHGIRAAGGVRDIYGFEDGLFFVQDEASQLCVEILGAKPGDTVIDVCAAPGSKSFGAAINMQNRGKIFSFDLHKSKISLIESGAARLGIDIVNAGARDAKIFCPELENTADVLLCDVPCSGYGVISKKPELRYKDPAECAPLPLIQREILANSARYVKPGGTLVYSTCTLFPEENEDVVREFLAENKNFELYDFDIKINHSDSGFITLYPDIHNTDGFFAARMRRIK